ncbi:hypothetical protein M0812_06613 [Anaeramoeba flamelloides]|uniref:Uncharacterized protein n=1 Tax=Anaeramoeba flamelloides TaxID=1746091 RepID=A0AAV8ACL0_9EUKA|nr:hypothetical protein M0812_06613 [Anaeramoeba flamelloides]
MTRIVSELEDFNSYFSPFKLIQDQSKKRAKSVAHNSNLQKGRRTGIVINVTKNKRNNFDLIGEYFNSSSECENTLEYNKENKRANPRSKNQMTTSFNSTLGKRKNRNLSKNKNKFRTKKKENKKEEDFLFKRLKNKKQKKKSLLTDLNVTNNKKKAQTPFSQNIENHKKSLIRRNKLKTKRKKNRVTSFHNFTFKTQNQKKKKRMKNKFQIKPKFAFAKKNSLTTKKKHQFTDKKAKNFPFSPNYEKVNQNYLHKTKPINEYLISKPKLNKEKIKPRTTTKNRNKKTTQKVLNRIQKEKEKKKMLKKKEKKKEKEKEKEKEKLYEEKENFNDNFFSDQEISAGFNSFSEIEEQNGNEIKKNKKKKNKIKKKKNKKNKNKKTKIKTKKKKKKKKNKKKKKKKNQDLYQPNLFSRNSNFPSQRSLRRSKRTRILPIKFWKERAIYEMDQNGCQVLIGVERTDKPLSPPQKQDEYPSQNTKKNKTKKKI